MQVDHTDTLVQAQPPRASGDAQLVLRLYVAGATQRSVQIIAAVRHICVAAGYRFVLEVIDVYQQPQRASADRILVTPTLLFLCPPPEQRLIGGALIADSLASLFRFRTTTGAGVVSDAQAGYHVTHGKS